MASPVRRPSAGNAGFSLVELIVVLILVSVLAVVALPRLNFHAFDNVGFYEEVLSSVRYAQKEAIAKRRNVCVIIAANSVTVRFAKAVGATTCDTDLTSPRGTSPFVVTAGAGETLASAPPIPNTFFFDPLGRPFDAANTASVQRTISIAGDALHSFVIEPETGYVHP